ncbi:MAG: sulfate adenylyltransferase [Burkholderiales bacterium]|nr:sulfate adenylyltransferase [Burkholderiales bacterium]
MSRIGEIERDAVQAKAADGDAGVLRFITAGSVDDGKSTLIGRLLHDTRQILADQLAAVSRASRKRGHDDVDLSLLTDGLEAEREQGITIDVAYRYFATPQRKFIIADTPGHEQYTRNMVTAASTADAAVILADAGKGLLPQGRRHLCIASLLGIRHVVVAVNKMDSVGYSQSAFESIRADFSAFAQRLGLTGVRFVPVSALRGDMVVDRGDALSWYAGPTLLDILESIEPVRSDISQPLRFPVQLVQRSGRGRAYLGRVRSGRVSAGDTVLALPSGRRVRVAGVHAHAGELAEAQAGDSVALTLGEEIDLARGDLIAGVEGAPRLVQQFDATLVWLSAEPLVKGAGYLLKSGTRTVRARVSAFGEHIDVQTLEARPAAKRIVLNDILRVTLTAQQPLPVDAYRVNRGGGAFILIDEVTHQTVAGGMVA